MHFEDIDGVTHIFLDQGDNEQEVLRAIAVASFNTAPKATSFQASQQYNASQKLDLEAADQFMYLNSGETLFLDYFRGRLCKTCLTLLGDGHFELNNVMYEQDRGKPDEMLKLAQSML